MASSSSARSSRTIAGLVLLLVAAIALLERFTSLQLGVAAPFLIGAAFLIWALVGRQSPMLIPAGILLGLGSGLILERWLHAGGSVDRAVFLLCFGAGFASITVLSRLAFRQRVRWPLIPAAVMIVLGLLRLGGASLPQAGQVFQQTWPFLALAVGAWLLLSRRRAG